MKKQLLTILCAVAIMGCNNACIVDKDKGQGEPNPFFGFEAPFYFSDDLQILVCIWAKSSEGTGDKTIASNQTIEADKFSIRITLMDEDLRSSEKYTSMYFREWYDAHIHIFDCIVSSINNYYDNPRGENIVDIAYMGLDKVSVTADKKLFGRDAGENLADKFRINDYVDNEMLFSYPDGKVLFSPDDKKPLLLSDLPSNLLMLRQIYVRYVTLPTEQYNDITFTFRFTVNTEEGERTMSGSATAYFSL